MIANNTDLKTTISSQIEELNKRRILFFFKTVRIKECNNMEILDDSISRAKGYSIGFIVLSAFCGVIIYVDAFAHIFLQSNSDLNKLAPLITMAVGYILIAWYHRINYERLKTIKYLVDLKSILPSSL